MVVVVVVMARVPLPPPLPPLLVLALAVQQQQQQSFLRTHLEGPSLQLGYRVMYGVSRVGPFLWRPCWTLLGVMPVGLPGSQSLCML